MEINFEDNISKFHEILFCCNQIQHSLLIRSLTQRYTSCESTRRIHVAAYPSATRAANQQDAFTSQLTQALYELQINKTHSRRSLTKRYTSCKSTRRIRVAA